MDDVLEQKVSTKAWNVCGGRTLMCIHCRFYGGAAPSCCGMTRTVHQSVWQKDERGRTVQTHTHSDTHIRRAILINYNSITDFTVQRYWQTLQHQINVIGNIIYSEATFRGLRVSVCIWTISVCIRGRLCMTAFLRGRTTLCLTPQAEF